LYVSLALLALCAIVIVIDLICYEVRTSPIGTGRVILSMISTPKVSVVIPIKGRPQLFELAAQSLVDQTYASWEVVVVDDGSSADEFKRIAEIAGRDERMILMKNPGPRPGASACRNAGLAVSRGEYVVFMDSDDALAATCLQRRVEVMKSNPEVDFAVFSTAIFRAIPGDTPLFWNQFTSENDLDRFLRFDTPWHTSGPIWKATSLQREGPWDDRALCAQDWEFHIRAVTAGLSYIKVPEPDSFWRVQEGGSITSSWLNPCHVRDRVRLLERVIAALRLHGALTGRRRRMLAGLFYVHAFRAGLDRRVGVQIWRTGRRTGVVRPLQFVTVLAIECASWMAQRALFPELRMVRTQLLATTPAVPGEAALKQKRFL
jgi:glycosyltransferase involved in cell wall biosynthesis